MNSKLGDYIFSNIEANEYLQELFTAILYNYSLDLFRLQKKERKQFNVVDALRFSDLLSKSTDPVHAEQHKTWAQVIVALLKKLYPDDNVVEFCLGSVLSNVCNYRGLMLKNNAYNPLNTFEKAYEEYKKSYLKIPSPSNGYFFKSQKDVFDSIRRERFSYSGPTSMGKSFVIRMFITEQITTGEHKNYAIVVPTKALINEVSGKIINDLKELLAEKNYRVVTVVGALSLKQKHNFILVLTPERLLYLLLENPQFHLDYLFIDEAHKISSKDGRSPFYYKIVDFLERGCNKPHFIFSAPNIPNPEVYLDLLNQTNVDYKEKMMTKFSPVSQLKFLIDLIQSEVKLYNDYDKNFITIATDNKRFSFAQIIKHIGENSQNIVYCNATAKAIDYAREYASLLNVQNDNPQLLSLAREVEEKIHADYYLVDLLKKGVAYHIGYLPSDIRLQIEDLFRAGAIKTIFCTSTLIEGVNLPADNLFITSYKNGLSKLTPVEFRNLIGRVGRIEFNLFGNVFLTRIDDKVDPKIYVDLIGKDVPNQKLSIVTELSLSQKKKIVESLIAGNIEFQVYPNSQSADNYSLMRKFALILLKDIVANRNSYVKRAFAKVLSPEIEDSIRSAFPCNYADEDITVSSDQIGNLQSEIAKGLSYPTVDSQGNINYKCVMAFLERLALIFKWDKYEKATLGRVGKDGSHRNLRWYAVVLLQWIQGNGLSYIIMKAIEYKNNHPSSGVKIENKIVDYDDSIQHRNVVISETLNTIEEVILFRISNYFLRFSSEYKRLHHIEAISNDWYEYVEYGTMDRLTIFLQRNGFSREASMYIRQHKEYITSINDDYKVSVTILECPNQSIRKEASDIKYNIPELFV